MADAFDKAELLDRVGNDLEFLAETIAMLAEDGPALLTQLRTAIAAGDAAAVGRHAHAMKGMVSNFCAPAASAAALDLEKLGKGGDLAEASRALQVLSDQITSLTAGLSALIQERA